MGIGEHVRMTAYQLGDDVSRDVVDGPAAVRVLSSDARMEDHLEQQVTELLAQVIAVAGLDRLDRLVGLLDQVGDQRLVGLLRVPGAAAGRAQPVHHRDEVEQRGTGKVVGAGQHLELGRRCSRGHGGGQRETQVGIAVVGDEPHHDSVLGGFGDEVLGERAVVALAHHLHRDVGLGEVGQHGMVGRSGQDPSLTEHRPGV